MKKFIYITFFISLSYFLGVSNIYAADVFIVADKTTISENQTFTVSVYTDTKGANINNAEGLVSYPSDLLSVESVNSNGSIFSVWVDQPKVSNAGTISFNGGVPNPGYIGAKGKIFNIFFKAKKTGSAKISFSSANVYANDGMGTDITSSKNGTVVTIAQASVVKPIDTTPIPKEVVVQDKLLPAPVITSTDAPDEESWYSLDKATFSWNLPSGVTAVQISYDHSPDSVPSVIYNTPINKKEIKNITDGVHYLHLRFKNSAGWSKITHRKIKTDTVSPVGLEVLSSFTEDKLVSLDITSKDITSGLNKYKVLIDGVVSNEVKIKDNNTIVVLPLSKSGNREVSVTVYDNAGNLSEKTLNIEFPKVEAPVISKYSSSVKIGEKIEINGSSYPNEDVRIWIQPEGGDPNSYIVKTKDDKTFSFTSEPVSTNSLISIWAEALIKGSTGSSPSDKYFVRVNKTSLSNAEFITTGIFPISVPFILLLLITSYLIYKISRRPRKESKKLHSDLEQTEDDIRRVFRIIKEDVKQSFKILKADSIKKKLSQEDIEVFETLSKDIQEAEEYFVKKIKNIENKDL